MGSCPYCKKGGDLKKKELFIPQYNEDIALENTNKNRTMTKLIRKNLSKKMFYHKLTTEKIIRGKSKKIFHSMILKKTPNNLLKFTRNISLNIFHHELKKQKV